MSPVVIGVDPHKRSATIEIVDGRERTVGQGRFGTDNDGYRRMLDEGRRRPDRVWAVEGCNGVGTEERHQPTVIVVLQVHPAADLGQPHLHTGRAQQRHQLVELPPAERPLVLTHHDRVEPRSGSANGSSNRAASGRLGHRRRREAPSSKNSATTVPCPATRRSHTSRCHNREERRSWCSEVDIRP
ncbi:hypothetical protein F4560_003098 [Saccharothrix ecbatanensis]|uniref:Transposase n=1 Tax=Saccharothrix ecbatanensis TaxID=1105145 RepID=A0A7W9HJL1_9PSEU|nr:hypothetical protein [Saccharothrix ecbatanensis]MBB5803330.1 hypothetical protein [Saccharothrix ecbatanensis]